MSNLPSCSTSKVSDVFEDEVFDDSSFMAKFDHSFKQTPNLAENNMNETLNRSGLNVSALCCDEEIKGYDKLTGRTWIYPTNYPVRDYQFNIIRAALVKNTLVSLPTGLGKTFIAAVIMYNFYRWYPLGKIIFTAPTRPLVAQQIEACYNIVGINPDDTIEMTGHMQVNTRKVHWQNKRVFFATPQVIYNDIKSGICPCDNIRCLVIDEAHRARGNYAYCQIVATLDDMGFKTYRLLALSATPGSKVEDVVNVVKHLHIAHLELRTENCIDVAPYSHARKINTVVIELGPQLTQLRQQYVEILDGYARRLKQLNILPQNLGNLSKGRIVMMYKDYQSRERGARHPQHNYIMKDFTVLIALYHGLELLSQHGARVFLNFFDEHPEKSWIQADDKLTMLLERLRDDMGVNPLSLDRSILPDGTVPEMPKDLCFGHPKFDKLKDIMTYHFAKAKQNKQDTRAIVFCEYRESVNLVHCLLLQCRPLITPQMFVGQGASGKDGKTVVSQKQQLRVMRGFRSGSSNVLVATCVAEEGLDVGEVDLIVCFDISTRSPVRLVQRCGRTGRERGGQVYILVTEGREHQTLVECMRQRDGLNKKILQSKEVDNNLYKLNPRMLPRDFTPQCQKMHIVVPKIVDPKAKKQEEKSKEGIDRVKKGQKDLRTMFGGRPSTSNASNIDSVDIITEKEFKDLYPDGYCDSTFLAKPEEYWAMDKRALQNVQVPPAELNLCKWLEWQRRLQRTVNIDHSKDSEILSELLQYCDAKRFEMPPSTQHPAFNTQEVASQQVTFPSPIKSKPKKKERKAPISKSPAKKDGDIRALFSTATKSTKSYTKLITDLGIQNDGNIPTKLISLLVDLSLDNTKVTKKCYICENICKCNVIQDIVKEKKPPDIFLKSLKELVLPDIDLIDDLDKYTIVNCSKTKDESVNKDDIVIERTNFNNFDLEAEFLFSDDYESPIKSMSPIKCLSPTKGVSPIKGLSPIKSLSPIKIMSPIKTELKLDTVNTATDNFDLGDIAEIFANSSPEEAIETEIAKIDTVNEIDTKIDEVKVEESEAKDALGFFGLDSIDDIFADDEIDNTPPQAIEIKTNTKFKNISKSPIIDTPRSPSILSGKIKVSTSPILCSQARKFSLSTKKTQPKSSTPNCRTELLKEFSKEKASNNEYSQSILQDSKNNTTNKSMFTITQLVDMINKSDTKEHKKPFDGHVDNDRSCSPILLTQAEKNKTIPKVNNSFKTKASTSQTNLSLIILESDSDSDSTQIYDPIEKNETIFASPVSNKRKTMDDPIQASPYFNKKPKLQTNKEMTLQEKVLAAITSNKLHNFKQDDSKINYVTQTNGISKENKSPIKKLNTFSDALQMFKRDRKTDMISKFNGFKSPVSSQVKRKVMFNDSDDDFEEKSFRSQPVLDSSRCTNHKVRKKKKKTNAYLDTEAEVSSEDDSGDELSDDSVGSIADFICDEDNVTHEDMQALYLKSIKSPVRVKGGFKIPELPKKYNKEAVLSQFVEEDSYEMDSFCVDSHIGLTQANETSELDVAEMLLEERRKKKSRRILSQDDSRDKMRSKPKRRQIHSDSDDSS